MWHLSKATATCRPGATDLGDAAFDRNGIIGVRKGDRCFLVYGRVLREGANHAPYRALASTIAAQL